MRLADLIDREPARPWQDGGKIPWHDPGFSTRILREHLSQDHDRASRRFETIDRHVSWLHHAVLCAGPARVLDLGCGPGLYTSRLARLGHHCVGVDFSPAAIAHARAEALRCALSCEYRLEDLRVADFGSGYEAALLLFGEFNTFPPDDARELLARARHALTPGGALVLEVLDEDLVRAAGDADPTWFAAEKSVFSDAPHLCLSEATWHPELRVATERYRVYPLAGGEPSVFTNTTQAYTDAEYDGLLYDAGFQAIGQHGSLAGAPDGDESGLFVRVARTEESP